MLHSPSFVHYWIKLEYTTINHVGGSADNTVEVMVPSYCANHWDIGRAMPKFCWTKINEKMKRLFIITFVMWKMCIHLTDTAREIIASLYHWRSKISYDRRFVQTMMIRKIHQQQLWVVIMTWKLVCYQVYWFYWVSTHCPNTSCCCFVVRWRKEQPMNTPTHCGFAYLQNYWSYAKGITYIEGLRHTKPTDHDSTFRIL